MKPLFDLEYFVNVLLLRKFVVYHTVVNLNYKTNCSHLTNSTPCSDVEFCSLLSTTSSTILKSLPIIQCSIESGSLDHSTLQNCVHATTGLGVYTFKIPHLTLSIFKSTYWAFPCIIILSSKMSCLHLLLTTKQIPPTDYKMFHDVNIIMKQRLINIYLDVLLTLKFGLGCSN